jgi:peptide/nickel transport system substrate-binding protein
MRIMRPTAAIAAALTLTLAAAACSSTSHSNGNGSGGAPSGTPTHGGTVTVAWISAEPNFIFPFAPATNSDGYN